MDQILSQSEVDSLLAAVDEKDPQAAAKKKLSVNQYDLANQDRIIRGRLPTLDIIHDRFIRLFRVNLSNSLRKMANVTVNSTGPIKFGELLGSLPVPSCLNILRLEPLRGVALMALDSKLLYALVDTFLGGADLPSVRVEGKDYTRIELKIAKRVVMMAIHDLEQAWKPVYPLKMHYTRSEVNPQFVAMAPPSDVVISTTFDVDLEKVSGNLKFIIPYSVLEPIKARLTLGFQGEQLSSDHMWIYKMREHLLETNIDLSVKLGDALIDVQDLMNLNEGDIIQLDHSASEPLDVLIEGIAKMKGVPGLLKGQKAIKIISTDGS